LENNIEVYLDLELKNFQYEQVLLKIIMEEFLMNYVVDDIEFHNHLVFDLMMLMHDVHQLID
jgi:hypothetical protein